MPSQFDRYCVFMDDLAAMKSAAGRPKDHLDLEEIEAIRRLSRRDT